MRTPRRPGGGITALLACFAAGGIVGWWLHAGPPVPAATSRIEAPRETRPISTASGAQPSGGGGALPTTGTGEAGAAIDVLHRRDLRVPIDGASVEAFKGQFDERRDSGGRPHEAVDMPAPRNTPVHAVENGTIAKLFVSKAGGNTVYQYDPSGRFCYYYAHLERYSDGLREGAAVARGDVIGLVGTSGNAPAGTPHLHFAIFELTADRHWWQGTAIDPYPVFRP
jgi:murein DD-endopeptidase MepM/ murein hydrolase activator NlpD